MMDEKFKNEIHYILGILIGASGYVANSLILWNTSVNKDRNDIAEGLYFDVSLIEDYLVTADQEFLANPDDKDIFVQGTPLYMNNYCTSPASGTTQ